MSKSVTDCSSYVSLPMHDHPQKKTIVAVLDCLISPRWPHPPCLPSDIVPCLSWQQLKDTPTHFHVTYDILESDVNGRLPDDAEYKCTPKTCYYNLAKHCQQTLNKVDNIARATPVTIHFEKIVQQALLLSWFFIFDSRRTLKRQEEPTTTL